ncbi:hypothetical protein SEA_KILLIGREW_36 [Mycobacterium phage Killigrew]|nr:hypothetical protein SEA_KILLIGREW_36 [Mycobacterium phage Killigrew]
MILGITGTRNPISEEQRAWLGLAIAEAERVHHGACVNADEDSHDLALEYGAEIVVHPPTNERLMMPREKWYIRDRISVRPAKPYNVRNRDIVSECDELLALPDGPYRQGSGTWNTIGFALDARKPVTIVYPDGRLERPRKPL